MQQLGESEHEQLLHQQNAEKIQNLRLQKEFQFLKSLNRTFEIVNRHQVKVENILHNNQHLHIYIPKQYPFKEPSYAISNNLQQKHYVSQIIEEWIPKVKIFELIQLLALRINQRAKLQEQIEHYTLLKPFHSTRALVLIIIIAVLLRVLIGLGSYSGAGDYPNLGDFQAHRNWMSITVSKGITDWYDQVQAEPWWRIDYPPVAAYLSYFFGYIYKNIEPQSMLLQRGYESQSLKVYMRLTVLIVDLLFLFPPILLLAKLYKKQMSSIFILLFLIKPDALLIDHGHFQYNSLILGLILMAFYCILTKQFYWACLLYTIAIHAKQMAVYYSLAFFAALLGLAFQENRHNKSKIIAQLLKYGSIVVIVSLIIWSPWLGQLQTLQSVVTAIFPIHRGLYQLKVSNFWCISDIFMKWQTLFSKSTLVFFCFFFSVLFSMPSMISLFLNSTRKTLTIAFSTISLTFYMFSYHVHQKSILLPLLMMPLVIQIIGGWLGYEVIIAGCVGMFHLLKEDNQQIGYFTIVSLYIMFNFNYLKLGEQLSKPPIQEKVLQWHHKLYQNKWLRVLFIVVLIALHVGQKLVTPPASLPYLHNLLFALFSFAFNCYFLLLGNWLQLEWINDWLQNRTKKAL